MKNGCVAEVEKVNPQQRWNGVKYRGIGKGLDILQDVNLHTDGNPGDHAYLCGSEEPPEDSLGNPFCPKPLEPLEIPDELEGNASRPIFLPTFTKSRGTA